MGRTFRFSKTNKIHFKGGGGRVHMGGLVKIGSEGGECNLKN